jgi:hypothetical protein
VRIVDVARRSTSICGRSSANRCCPRPSTGKTLYLPFATYHCAIISISRAVVGCNVVRPLRRQLRIGHRELHRPDQLGREAHHPVPFNIRNAPFARGYFLGDDMGLDNAGDDATP